MKYNPNIHHRRSIRLKGYEYTAGGYYFVTICSHNHQCTFGDIKEGKMKLNQYRKYIIENPLKWELDRENPRNIKNTISDTGNTDHSFNNMSKPHRVKHA